MLSNLRIWGEPGVEFVPLVLFIPLAVKSPLDPLKLLGPPSVDNLRGGGWGGDGDTYRRGSEGELSRTPLLTGETSKKPLLPARGEDEDVPSLKPRRLNLGGGSGLGGGGPGEACLVGPGRGNLPGLLGHRLVQLLLPPILNFKIDVNLFFTRFDDSSPFKFSEWSLDICRLVDCGWE